MLKLGNNFSAGGGQKYMFEKILNIVNEKLEYDIESLEYILSRLYETIEDFNQFMEFPHDGKLYGRNTIFKDNDIEILVITWPKNSYTNIHDHGDSIGCVKLIRGNLINVNYLATSKDNYVKEVSKLNVSKNGFLHIPREMIHQIVNIADDYSISLHAYAPPLNSMNIYADEK